jgi:hypothetical protein
MSTEIVIIIIGAALLLLAIGDSIKIKDSSTGLINIKIRISMGIIGVLLIIYGGYSFGLLNPQAQIEQVVSGNRIQVQHPVERVQVISPLEGDSVKCRILTMGVYPESHNKDIWVLLKPSDNKYYPQSDHTNTSYKRNGEWQVITRFGGDKGEVYDIIVYEADSTASLFFSSTIQSWKDSLSYPGLEPEELPEGAVEVDRIVVVLQDNCRGVF